jgi:hypothetical protein
MVDVMFTVMVAYICFVWIHVLMMLLLLVVWIRMLNIGVNMV